MSWRAGTYLRVIEVQVAVLDMRIKFAAILSTDNDAISSLLLGAYYARLDRPDLCEKYLLRAIDFHSVRHVFSETGTDHGR